MQAFVKDICSHYQDSHIIFCDGAIGLSLIDGSSGYVYEFIPMRPPVQSTWKLENKNIKFESIMVNTDPELSKLLHQIILNHLN